jgi:hypothetical protein
MLVGLSQKAIPASVAYNDAAQIKGFGKSFTNMKKVKKCD